MIFSNQYTHHSDYIEAEDVNEEKGRVLDIALDTLYQLTLINKDGIVVYMNKLYCDYLGWDQNDVVGRRITDIIPNSRLKETIESGKATFDDIFTYEDGRQLIYSKLPVKNHKGETVGVASISSLNGLDRLNALNEEVARLRMSNELYHAQLMALKDAPSKFDSITSRSPKINNIKHVLNKVINSSMPILLTGESGTGKEVFANAIHNASMRKAAPFVKVNCAAIPHELLESELFGYEPGTFSGAIRSGKAGKFELANSGTILLDEIEELPLSLQPKLLRVLQEYEVERIGSVNPIKLNLQIICLSNSNLYELVNKGKFREDLLYRINALELEIPPLRDRMEDIPLLCDAIIKKINNRYKLNISGISDNAMSFLSTFKWPGNIRELEHSIERACVMVQSGQLTTSDFIFLNEKKRLDPDEYDERVVTREISGFYLEQEAREKEQIISSLRKNNGNKSMTAKELGISRGTLYSKIQKYGI